MLYILYIKYVNIFSSCLTKENNLKQQFSAGLPASSIYWYFYVCIFKASWKPVLQIFNQFNQEHKNMEHI